MATTDDNHRCQGTGSLLLPFAGESSEAFKRDIISRMNQDAATAAVRLDRLIMKFGDRLHFKHGHLRYRWQYIRERIREMGRLLVEVRKQVPSVQGLADCIVPEHFHAVVKAVRCLCGFDEDEHVYSKPSLALKMGHSLKECTRVEINNCVVQNSNTDQRQKHEEFLSLCASEWKHEISSHALRSLHGRKFNKPLVLPLAEDVKLLHRHLSEMAQRAMESLGDEPSEPAWCELCQVTLAQVVIFNRRRGGEAQRMSLSAYHGNVENVNEDIEGCLSAFEKVLCREFKIVYIEGKKGRKVPVLLTPVIQRQISLLAEHRITVGVSANNDYLFARRNSSEPYRSSDCLRRFASECKAKNPNAITSTKLRKHVATMSQMLALTENELDLLANFLGHDIRVHREYYRLPEQTLQVAKVSKLLIAMEHGATTSLQGLNLDNVDANIPGML